MDIRLPETQGGAARKIYVAGEDPLGHFRLTVFVKYVTVLISKRPHRNLWGVEVKR
ncbi:MAG TPA: hypothetical protein PKD52_05400 [Clostridiales bacterium]|nr:hypothetical protein [Clostridiales bacterium]